MFFIFIVVIFVIIASICFYWVGVMEDGSESQGFCAGMFVVSIVTAIAIFIFGIIANLSEYSSQIYSLENLKMIRANERIYADKADLLTREFVGYLAESYPNFEKSIFDKISPDDIDVYLVKYPELKSSETISLLVQEIGKLQSSCYEQRLKYQEELRNIHYRCNSPWLVFMPMPDPSLESF